MSNSRFVLKQIHVRGGGSSDLTRYVAVSKIDPVREGKSARALYTADADHLTFREARTWLSITGGALSKDEVLHYVLSFGNAREYELLGKDEEERERQTISFLRRSLPVSLLKIGVEEMRWAAGIHRNTDNPHVHLLFNKNAIHRDTKDLIRVSRLPAPIIAHHERTPEGQRHFSYGLLINSFAAQVDARHRERARFLQFENKLRTVSFVRELLPPEALHTRPPTEGEQLIGRWLVAEIQAARPPEILFTRVQNSSGEGKTESEVRSEAVARRGLADLREQAAQLDRVTLERGDEPSRAFIETDSLRAILTAPQNGFAVTAHEQNPSLMQKTRSREDMYRLAEQGALSDHFARMEGRAGKTSEGYEKAHVPVPPTHTR